MVKIIIKSEILDLNEYIKIGRTSSKKIKTKNNQFVSLGAIIQNNKKQIIEKNICFEIKDMPELIGKQYVLIVYYEKNNKKDDGNIKFKQKFIFDALQKVQKIKNDNRNCIITLFEPVLIDKKNQRIELYFDNDKNIIKDFYLNNYFNKL